MKWRKEKKSSRDERERERLSDPETFFLFFLVKSKRLTVEVERKMGRESRLSEYMKDAVE